uniref:T-cell-specific guanine nucleotide triphosphate-binding protein 2-like n=1 Tax=Jaculus jaculus TaxID=51337 RepID=UPI001E1B19D4|nr:T-cell-specific guanine nucleotide triphosphate-binding protein 2-like [Jaculus jaculus]
MGQIFSTPQPKDHDLASSFENFFKTFKMESKIISEDNITLIQSHIQKGDIQRTVSLINNVLKEIENAPLSIAVTGESGAGKSSFINALRGTGHEEPDAAEVGVVETTMHRKSYEHPKFPNVKIWDLPGIGTSKFIPMNYLKKVNFGEYDFFLIISCTRFTDHDAQLAKAIARMKKNFYFVRTKIDNDLSNSQRSQPKSFNRDKVLEKIRDNCMENLQQAKVDAVQVFLVSSLDVTDFDFSELEDTLLRDLPAQKRHIFMQCLPNVTEVAIERRRDSLKQMIWLESLKSGVSATIPLVGLLSDNDIVKLQQMLAFYRSYFGLDDQSLEEIATDLSVSAWELKQTLKSPHLLSLEKDESMEDKLKGYLEIFFSINGGLIATGLYFTKTYYLHNHFLDVVVQDAKLLLRRKDLLGHCVGSKQGCKNEKAKDLSCG